MGSSTSSCSAGTCSTNACGSPCHSTIYTQSNVREVATSTSTVQSIPLLRGSKQKSGSTNPRQAERRPVPRRPEKYATMEDSIAVLEYLDESNPIFPNAVKSMAAVLVADLGGFTSTMKQHGIIHFASIIARTRQLCFPIAQRRGCFHQTAEGSSIVIAFKNVVECAKAAFEIRYAIEKHNASLEKGMDKWSIDLKGIGVHCAAGLVIDKYGNMFGNACRVALELAEDCCQDGIVLISEDVRVAIADDPYFDDTKVSFLQYMGHAEVYEVVGKPGPLRVVHVATNDTSTLSANMMKLCARHDAGEGLDVLDEEIRREFLKPSSVLMINLDLEASATGGTDVLSLILEKEYALQLLSPILRKNGGFSVEPLLWMFENLESAVVAAVEGRKACEKHNRSVIPGNGLGIVKVEGWGVEVGPVLVLEGTDVHWGDPVVTASTLGQDLAKNGDILVTPSVKEALTQACKQGDERFNHWFFEGRHFSDPMELDCFCLYTGRLCSL